MVEKNDGTFNQFVYTPSGSLLARMSGQSVVSARVPLPGSWALYSATNTFNHYEHLDWLGNTRLSSYQGRTLASDIAYAPFGEAYASTSTLGVSFTGMRSDVAGVSGGTTNGLYDFLAREFPATQGRWLSPDPAGLGAVSLTNPQSLNRYAYVLNNPMSAADPKGLWCVWDDGSGHDDDPSQGGYTKWGCAQAGGHWDPTDTILNIWESNGVVTFMDVIGYGFQDVSGAGITLEQLDQMLYSTYHMMSGADSNMNGEQCATARTLLAREAKLGTSQTALKSAIGFGDGTLQAFNSSNTPPINTPVGMMKMDWYTVIQATGPDPSFGIVNSLVVYPGGKLIWTGLRLGTGAPITNYLPYTDADEINTARQTFSPFSKYSDIFTPGFMQANCGSH
jgi:RHS repeat-associated protein